MNMRSIIVGLSLATVSGLSQAGDPYYGPGYYGPHYGYGAHHGGYYQGQGAGAGAGANYGRYYGPSYYGPSYYAPSVKVEKSTSQEEYWDGPYYEKGSSSPYWVKRTRAKTVTVQPNSGGWVENPGRKYVERYAPHAAHHVPKYIPSEKVETKKTQYYTQNGKYYILKDGVYYEVATPKAEPKVETKVETEVERAEGTKVEGKTVVVPEEGKRYYIEDGVYKEIVPGTSSYSEGYIESSEGEVDGEAIGEYYRNRYGR